MYPLLQIKTSGAALRLPYRKRRLPRPPAGPVGGVLLHLPLLEHGRHGELRLKVRDLKLFP